MLLSFLALGAIGTAGVAFGSGYVVTLTPTGPQPPQVTAAIGDTVTFVNNDTVPHVVVARRDNLTTPTIPSGQTYAHVLTTSGNFTYRQEGGRDFPGTITVARTGGVSLAAKTRSILFGASVELRGKAHPTGFPVTVERRADTGGEYATLGTFVPGPDGAFSVKLRPRARTEYRASLLGKEFVSRGLVIEVRPGLTARVSAQPFPPPRP